MRHRPLRLLVAVVIAVVMLTAAPAQGATMQKVALPGDVYLIDLAIVDQDHWAALVSPAGSTQWSVIVTENQGKSWRTAQASTPDARILGLTAGRDGRYRLITHVGFTLTMDGPTPRSHTMYVVTTLDGSWHELSHTAPLPLDSWDPKHQGHVVDRSGDLWLPYMDGGYNGTVLNWGAYRITPAGHVDTVLGVPVRGRSTLTLFATPSGVGARLGGAETFHRYDGSAFVAVGGLALFRDKDTQIGPDRISVDGGATWQHTNFDTRPVYDAGEPAAEPTFVYGNMIMRRYADGIWTPTALQVPRPPGSTYLMGYPRVTRTATGFVALMGYPTKPDGTVPAREIYVWNGPAPVLTSESVSLPGPAGSFVASVNALRSAAGFPPLTVLAALNDAAAGPGSTSLTRCAVIMGGCGGMGISLDGTSQRTTGSDFFVSPYRAVTGIAVSGTHGSTVVGTRSNVLTKPFGFPIGTYRGPLDSSPGTDEPASCKAAATPLGLPAGTRISVYGPNAGKVTRLAVVGGGTVAGCQIHGAFIPASPLRPGTTYEASASLQRGALGQQSLTWRFRTADAAGDSSTDSTGSGARASASTRKLRVSRLRLSRRTLARSSATRRRATLTYVTSHAGKVTLTIQARKQGRRVGKRCRPASAATRRRKACTLWVRASTQTRSRRAGKNRATVTARRLRPGTYRATLRLTVGKAKSRTVAVSFRVRA